MADYYCENCECFEDRSTDKLIDGYCRRYNQSLIFYDWFEKCDKCIEEEKMTEQEIERCLERFATCKATDVMNFDYSGTLAYIKRLKAENAALRERLEKVPVFEIYQDVFIIDYLDERGYSVRSGKAIIRSCFIRHIMQVGKDSFIYFVQPNDLPKELLNDSTLHDEYWDRSFYAKDIFADRAAAEVRLAELKGDKNE